MMIEIITDGTMIRTEFQKPRDKPSQLMPVQACDQAFTNDRHISRNLGISSFPSLVIAAGQRRFNIPVNYNNARGMLLQIEEVIPLLRAT